MLTITMKFKLDEKDQKAIAYHFGEEGKADKGTCKTFLEMAAEASLTDALEDYERVNDD